MIPIPCGKVPVVLLINSAELASLAIRREQWLMHRIPTRKGCASCSGSWIKHPETNGRPTESEMELAPEPVRLAHANVLRAWVDMGILEYGPSFGNKYT